MAGSGPTSGVQVDDHCMDCYSKLHHNHSSRYVIFKLSEDLKRIVVDKVGERDATYDEFMEVMVNAEKDGEGRYAIYDHEYDVKGTKKAKVVFFLWIPDNIKVKQKMLYSSSEKALKGKLKGIQIEMQCNDCSDLELSNLQKKCLERDYDA